MVFVFRTAKEQEPLLSVCLSVLAGKGKQVRQPTDSSPGGRLGVGFSEKEKGRMSREAHLLQEMRVERSRTGDFRQVTGQMGLREPEDASKDFIKEGSEYFRTSCQYQNF